MSVLVCKNGSSEPQVLWKSRRKVVVGRDLPQLMDRTNIPFISVQTPQGKGQVLKGFVFGRQRKEEQRWELRMDDSSWNRGTCWFPGG